MLFNVQDIAKLNKIFLNAQPFPFICIDNFLDIELAHSLQENFPSLSEMETLYNGLNEKKGEHSSFQTLHEDFRVLKEALSSKEFINKVENITGINDLFLIDDRYGRGLHQGGSKSFLDIHIDYNLHPIRKKQRRLNLILFLNDQWQKDWGGNLEFWNASRTNCIASIEPLFNRCIIFICNDISYHGYSSINCPPAFTRKSFYLYFFSEPQKKLLFHDTVFTTLPNDSIIRKFKITIKESLKKYIKRILFHSCLSKFLK